jgi:hypothetical protein
MAADGPYSEFYDFYGVSPEYFGYTLVMPKITYDLFLGPGRLQSTLLVEAEHAHAHSHSHAHHTLSHQPPCNAANGLCSVLAAGHSFM